MKGEEYRGGRDEERVKGVGKSEGGSEDRMEGKKEREKGEGEEERKRGRSE